MPKGVRRGQPLPLALRPPTTCTRPPSVLTCHNIPVLRYIIHSVPVTQQELQFQDGHANISTPLVLHPSRKTRRFVDTTCPHAIRSIEIAFLPSVPADPHLFCKVPLQCIHELVPDASSKLALFLPGPPKQFFRMSLGELIKFYLARDPMAFTN